MSIRKSGGNGKRRSGHSTGKRGKRMRVTKRRRRKTSPYRSYENKSISKRRFVRDNMPMSQSHRGNGKDVEFIPLKELQKIHDIEEIINDRKLLRHLTPYEIQDLAREAYDLGYQSDSISPDDNAPEFMYGRQQIREVLRDYYPERFGDIMDMPEDEQDWRFQNLWEEYLDDTIFDVESAEVFDVSISIPDDFRFYHGTSTQNARKILESGSIGGGTAFLRRSNYAFLADEKGVAHNYGGIVFELDGSKMDDNMVSVDTDVFTKGTGYDNERYDNQYVSDPVDIDAVSAIYVDNDTATRLGIEKDSDPDSPYYKKLTPEEFLDYTS